MLLKTRLRAYTLLVLLFACLATAFLWWQALRSQALLRDQVLLQAEQRSQHLADAMAGQVQGVLSSVDLALLDLRAQWLRTAERHQFDGQVRDKLASLPSGMVAYATVVDAQGYVVFNSLGLEAGTFVGDRPHFSQHRTGGDQLGMGVPVLSRLTGEWSMVVSRPILRQGRFDGTVHMLLSTHFMAQKLGALMLSDRDVVALVHPSGFFLARSRDNAEAMGRQVPADRPFLLRPDLNAGVFKVPGLVDGTWRTYGWERVPGTGAVLVVGLAKDSVLAPLAPGFRRSMTVTATLSALLVVGGALIAALLWRLMKGQAALAGSEARLREAQRIAALGSWECDIQTGRVVWSDELYRLFGVDPGTFEPSFERSLERVPPEERAALRETYRQALSEGVSFDVMHRVLLPGGAVKHVREVGMTQHEGGRPVRSLGTVQDVTALRSAQIELQQLNEQLESRVDERTAELTELNRELAAFTYSVSHDLRTPLRSIHGFAHLLEEDEDAALSPSGRQYLQRIQDGSRRMGQLITDLLALAHLGRADMRQERVNLSELAHALAAELQRSEPGRVVHWEIEDDLCVMADPGLMRVVMQNLLGNAWKYTGQRAVATISVTKTSHRDGMVEFCVRDNGAGFDMAYVAQLFQPFRRLHAHHEFEGSGVGLATVARVVRRHGGEVRGVGAVAGGAAFFVRLPEVPVVSELTPW
ncbi:MAG: PAS domain-containing protein [Hydrogenophaga sp.]|nr:PAS domain-containing protein [Hydrogenophaga sp.]